MTRIKNKNAFKVKQTPVSSDYVIGTDSENNGKTVSFEVGSLRRDGVTLQNNRFKNIDITVDISGSVETLESLISTAINNLPKISGDSYKTILEDQIPLFTITIKDSGIIVGISKYVTNLGLGVYGQEGNVIVTSSNLISLSNFIVESSEELGLQEITDVNNVTTKTITAKSFVKEGGLGDSVLLDDGTVKLLSDIGGSNDIEQDNKPIGFSVSVSDFSETEIANRINQLPSFTVSEYVIPIFVGLKTTGETKGKVTALLNNKGKGSYGVGGVNLTGSDVVIVSLSKLTLDEIVVAPSTQSIDLGNIGTNLIQDAFNNYNFNGVEIQEQTEGYVIVDAIQSGQPVSYLFSGGGGFYGSGQLGVEVAYQDDFKISTTVPEPIDALPTGGYTGTAQDIVDSIVSSTNPITKTSDITNDGEDGINPFITANDLPAPQTLPTKTSELTNDGEDGNDPFAKVSELPTMQTLPTKTSDLTNDGEDGNNPFLTADDLPSGTIPENVAYGTSWEGNLNATSKDSLFKKFESLDTSGTDTNIYNTYRVSKNAGDIEAALAAITSLNASSEKQHVLIIDQDVNLTGTPRTITVNHPMLVHRGRKFITPLVSRSTIDESNPIVGTVAENYMQLQINGRFYVDRDQHIFEGDGLIWFGEKSVDEVWADWFGITYNGNREPSQEIQSANVIAIQKAVNCVSLDKGGKATSLVKIGNGNIYINSPIVSISVHPDNSPFIVGRRLSGVSQSNIIRIHGVTPIKHEANTGESTSIFYTANWGAPLMVQSLRNSEFKNIRFEGKNDFMSYDNVWLGELYPGYNGDNFIINSLRPAYWKPFRKSDNKWVKEEIQYYQKKPYAAIITDPFKTTNTSIYAYSSSSSNPIVGSTVDLYYATTALNHQNSWSVIIENMHIRRFVEGIVNTLTGQQGDTYVYRQIMLQELAFGISTTQDQSRDCKAYEVMAYSGVFALFENTVHGQGVVPEVMSAHSAGSLKFIHYGFRTDGILNFSNIYAEAVYGFGATNDVDSIYDMEGVAVISADQYDKTYYPASINNSTIKIFPKRSFTTNSGTHYLKRPPTIYGANIYSTFIGVYGTGFEAQNVFVPLANCNISGLTKGIDGNDLQPFDMGWMESGSTLIRNYKRTNPNFSKGAYFTSLMSRLNTVTQDNIKTFLFDGSPWKLRSFHIDETVRKRLLHTSNNHPYTYYPNQNKITTVLASVDGLKAGSYLESSVMGYKLLGVVQSIVGNEVTIASFSDSDIARIETNVASSGTNTGSARFSLIFRNYAHRPFLATKSTPANQIIIHDYAAQYNNKDVVIGGLNLQANTEIQMPDGNTYYVVKVIDGVATLNKNYTGVLNYDWVEPLHPNTEATHWNYGSVQPNTSYFTINYYYSKGKRYEYWVSPSISSSSKQEGYLLCVKSGDFYDAEEGGDQRASAKADFLRYTEDNKLVEFISGTTTLFPMTVPHVIPFNRSGNMADRPDNVGFPTEHIPNGFVYINTETSEDQIWTGSTFKTLT